ncbi:hypothetical protein D3870_16365 [Noviherbaspirillum cavernae]|uniref:HTTM domain-containing protein n=2 Tax=Noviherbaspirillum cavernae TaxID=2320862 RepID=A0A418X4Q4_9BURK|nr:hypothetical protein D3870_16365 [Noviherbaspirillum cavernae]
MLLAISLWLTLDTAGGAWSWDHYVASFRSIGWIPKGLVKCLDLVTHGPPSQDFVISLFVVAKVACAMMFFGLFSRTAAIVAALTTTLYASLMSSFGPYWSHSFNVQLLAALSFMLGRSGDVLSIDALIRRIRSLPSPLKQHDGLYWWPVLFAELSTHMFMFGAFYQKWTVGNGIWWAWSDNLRNALAVSWGVARFNVPETTLWVMNNPWVYKTAGTMQLIAQFSTIFCLFLVRHPVLRMVIGGSFFFLEIIGLTRLFEFWHPFWVPLCLLSVDWEWLYGKIKGRDVRPKSAQRGYLVVSAFLITVQKRTLDVVDNIVPTYRLAVYAFMALFFGYYAANIVWKLGEKHLNYPFSSMAFYSENRAIPPYSNPNYFPYLRGWIEIETAKGKILEPQELPSTMLDSVLGAGRSEEEQRKLHESEMLLATHAYWRNSAPIKSDDVVRLRAYTQIVAVPPRPRPALPMVVLHSGLTSVKDERGFRGVTPSIQWDKEVGQYVISIQTFGFTNPSFRILARRNIWQIPSEHAAQPLAGEWRNGRFYMANIPRESEYLYLYTVIEVTDKALGVIEEYAGPENFPAYK